MNTASSLIDWSAAGDLFLSPGGTKLTLVLLLLLLIAPFVIIEKLRERRSRAKVRTRTGSVPAPREVWWADVPFEDGPGSKDRPCLVLKTKGRTAVVAKITSKDHSGRPGVIPLPRGMVGDRQGRAGWLETDELREVPMADFRRRVGQLDGQTWASVKRTAG
jgi:mRNA-degrading endonuclease toxin of MazEF toxin-antitoxin module